MGKPWEKLDCRLAITDSPVADNPEFARCPNHDDQRASFAVYRDHGYCYVCKFYLRPAETLAFLLFGDWSGPSLQRALGVMDRYTAEALDAYRARVDQNVKTDPLPLGLAYAYHQLLWSGRSSRLQWLTDRGLTSRTIERCVLGHDGTRFTIPVFSPDGLLLTIRFRRDDFYGTTEFHQGEDRPLPKYSGMRGRNGLFLYRARGQQIDDWVVVVEGELDAVRLSQEGIPAVSATNGAGNVAKVPALLQRDYPQVKRLFLATDRDEAGMFARMGAAEEGRRLGFSVSSFEWNPDYKDVTELYCAGGSLDKAWCDGDETKLPARG